MLSGLCLFSYQIFKLLYAAFQNYLPFKLRIIQMNPLKLYEKTWINSVAILYLKYDF